MKVKRICSLLCVLLLCSAIVLCGCSKDEPTPDTPDSGEAVYKVTVVNGAGEPYTEKIVVKLLQGSEQIAMLPVNGQGAVEKSLPKGEYTVEIMSTDSSLSFFYDAASAKLTADKTELELVLALEVGEGYETISANSISTGEYIEYKAYHVSAGTTHVTVSDEDRTYFLFIPTEAGAYELSVVGGKAEIGVYGASVHFINSDSLFEVTDGKLSLSVQPSMISSGNTGTTVYVIGLDGEDGVTDVMLNIIRAGEPEWSFTEQPWSEYSPANPVTDYVLPEGTALKSFDLTAASDAYILVYNQTDGYYHLNAEDGPLVFAQLGQTVYGICLMDMVGEIVYQDGVLMQTGSAPFRYSYDNGQDDYFKEDYTNAMRQYVTCRDSNSGVYPLDADLYYILTMGIDAMGWSRPGTVNYRFADLSGVNDEISWMFLLMYEDSQLPAEDSSDSADSSNPSDSIHTHSYIEAVTAPTCTKEGYTTLTCDCGESYIGDKTNPTGHSYGEWITIKEPTTTATGKAERKCKLCAATEERTLDKIIENHTHSYVSSVTKAPACTAEGVTTYTCSCGGSYTESMAVLGHDYKAATVAPTCTEQGYTSYTCSRCADGYKTAYTVAKGHSYNDGKCSSCGEKDPDFVVEDNKDEPIEIGSLLEFDVEVQAGHLVYYNIYRVSGTKLTISNSNAYVVYDGVTYEAQNGVVTIPELLSDDVSFLPVALAIGNKGSQDATFTVKLTYPAGSLSNPHTLSTGNLTTKLESGNSQGIYYNYTATQSGTLTVSLRSITSGAQAGISLCNKTNSVYNTLEESGGTSVSIEVQAGDIVEVVIATRPDAMSRYPAATIRTTVSFE